MSSEWLEVACVKWRVASSHFHTVLLVASALQGVLRPMVHKVQLLTNNGMLSFFCLC